MINRLLKWMGSCHIIALMKIEEMKLRIPLLFLIFHVKNLSFILI